MFICKMQHKKDICHVLTIKIHISVCVLECTNNLGQTLRLIIIIYIPIYIYITYIYTIKHIKLLRRDIINNYILSHICVLSICTY